MAFANYDRNDTRRPKTLRITPQDVKQAKRGDCGHCVLATAARNQWGWKTYVSATVLWRKVGKKLVRYAIDRVGRKAVKMFDSTDVW